MKTFATIVLALNLIQSFGQVNSTEKIDYECQGDFANAGEAEQCWAERLFRKEYKLSEYRKFDGEIIRKDATFHFGKDELEVINTANDLLLIFEKGLLHPELMAGSFKERKKEVKLKISSLEQVKIPDTPSGTMRFKFMEWYPNVANPIVYFIELTNKNPNDKDLKSFIKNSRLTFYKQGWVMI